MLTDRSVGLAGRGCVDSSLTAYCFWHCIIKHIRATFVTFVRGTEQKSIERRGGRGKKDAQRR